MSSSEPIVITRKQARRQVDKLGISLIIYILLFTMIRYSNTLFGSYEEGFLHGFDNDIVMLVGFMILLIFVTFVPFNLSAKSLHLDIKDYLKKPNINRDKQISLVCLGIGIQLICISVSMMFYFFFHTNLPDYAYLGDFRTVNLVIKNILYFIFFVMIRPYCDEYIFRGVIQRQLGHYGRYFGVLGSAFLYAIAQVNLVKAVPAFFVGWYLALITLKYHSIKPSIKIHISISAFMFLVDVLPPKLTWILTVLIGFVYIVSALSIFQKRVSTHMVRYGATDWNLWSLLLSSPTIIVSMILFAANVYFSFL